ncbi:hypothetical protein B0H11DRAFT_1944196 [Mycena galericulata]|nr:hypothetical protein B0H11DRAFT_1944196 [Mycena galericulata]
MAYLPPNSTAIVMPPSASDRPGAFYTYFDPTFSIAKMGRSNDPPRRKLEWARQCRGEAQIWLPFYWEVPFAAKFERIIHHHYQRAGAWLGPVRCTFCGVNHREKYWFHGYSELVRFITTVEHYLGVLGWPIIIADTPPTPSGGRGRCAAQSGRRGGLRRCRRRVWYTAGFQGGSGSGSARRGTRESAPAAVVCEQWEREWDRMRERERGDEAVPKVGKVHLEIHLWLHPRVHLEVHPRVPWKDGLSVPLSDYR